MTSELSIREILQSDASGVAMVIRTVMPEFGATGPGFAINDPEVDDMFKAYRQQCHAYFVVVAGERVIGGAGIAPLAGIAELCELRKMYFLPEARGRGFGQALMDRCLTRARELGFKACYLETLKSMCQAQKLYLRNGFLPLEAPLGNTGHFSCDSFYLKNL